ncbi:T9SS type A sorting domain-containing protein [candidate division KSB1 bacterium]|nr:T9SS type A sorting domain-containing protein [candidate division KSB1 bacterium]
MKIKIFTLLILFFTAVLFAQTKTVDRIYTPIVQTVSEAPLLNLEYEKWRAYSYDSVQQIWTQVAFQVDNVNDEGKYNTEVEDPPVLDDNDEIVLMPQDLGDKAPFSSWIGDKNKNRIELFLTDPLDTLKTGWIYLYFDGDNGTAVPDYFSPATVSAESPAADTVHCRYYTLGFSDNGWMNYLILPQTSKTDLVDRLKLRLSGEPILPSIPNFLIDEDALVAKVDDKNGPVDFRIHPVRSFHDRRAKLFFPFELPAVDADHQIQYFPYSMYIGLIDFKVNPGLIALFGLKAMRQSLDLSEETSGMTFYSANNTQGLPIDGQIDTFSAELDTTLTSQWLMASGNAGTIVLILGMLQVENSVTALYYHDNNTNVTLDETPDTGDQESFSDMGLWIKSTGEGLKTGSLTMIFSAYFIDRPNLTTEFGQQLMDQALNPLTLAAEEQIYVESGVLSNNNVPQKYALHPVYPNPFRHSLGRVNIEFDAALPNEKFDAVIYNLLGQKVAAIQNITAHSGRNKVTWNGRNKDGQPVPAGIYYLKLYNENVTLYDKMIVLDVF